MAVVTRLPTQHPRYPRCPECAAPLPNFNSMMLSFSKEELGGAELLEIIFNVRCRCGAEWDLRKKAKVQ